jgi:hypothetical protein
LSEFYTLGLSITSRADLDTVLHSLDVLLSNYTNRLFAVSGRFPSPTADNAVFLGPRVREGEMGYHIVQPLERNVGGGQVLVDRGFVPVSKIVNYKGDPTTWRLMDVSNASS